jgi:hypothetical protein
MPPLVKPSLAAVSPGHPVTAQGWNAIQDAVGALYDAVNALGGNTLEVQVREGTTALTDARVVAVSATAPPIEAVPPRAGTTAFMITGLTPGAWTVHVSVPGYTPGQSGTITIPSSSPVTVTLTPTTILMPDLLGVTATVAVNALSGASIQLDQILDVQGEEVNKTSLPADRATAKVLFQFPTPGTRITAATAKTRLVISAEPESQITTVPALNGMTYAQMVQALSDAGLRLGNIIYLTT